MAVGIVLTSTACKQPEQDRSPSPIVLSDTASGLGATLHAPSEHAPCLLLISDHQRNADRWTPLIARLETSGYAACVVTLPKEAPDWREVIPELRGLLDELTASGVDPENLFAGGEGLGGSLALYLALADARVQGLLILSPALEAQGLEIETAITELVDCPVLLMTAENDAYAAASASVLKTAAPIFCELRSYPGSAYGADLVSAAPSAGLQILAWLDLIRKSSPGNASGV